MPRKDKKEIREEIVEAGQKVLDIEQSFFANLDKLKYKIKYRIKTQFPAAHKIYAGNRRTYKPLIQVLLMLGYVFCIAVFSRLGFWLAGFLGADVWGVVGKIVIGTGCVLADLILAVILLRAIDGFFSRYRAFRENKLAYIFVSPAVFCLIMLHLLPLVQGVWMSMLKLDQFTFSQYLAAPFVGLKNYKDILFGLWDPASPVGFGFLKALRNTFFYAVIVTFGTLTIGMIVAQMLNRTFKGRNILRGLFLFPWIVPTFVVGMLWGFMWQKENGIINIILYDILRIDIWLGWLGVTAEKPFWLMGDPLTLAAIVIPTVWRGWPHPMLMILAGLQSISNDYFEAADIDGAGGWRKFWYITFPLLKPVWAILLLFGLIFNVYAFNIVYMMFGNGAGFPGDWGDLMMVNIFRNSFQSWNFGTGAALSLMLMLIMMVVVNFWYKFYRSVEEG
ncbi:MAG: sugar ABC transporter permease [Candidatus Margulisbacteria bacterium]|jgi:multiple sugar transport system permease protein|nr:sugar ABC transporter permease [Candidatus Margulisiibacteriota bacterium]